MRIHRATFADELLGRRPRNETFVPYRPQHGPRSIHRCIQNVSRELAVDVPIIVTINSLNGFLCEVPLWVLNLQEILTCGKLTIVTSLDGSKISRNKHAH